MVGAPETFGKQLAATYPFVTYLGYLNNDALRQEVGSWTFFLNPVFYYSRGVSTKLAKAFGWGIPVITTTIGCRGYVWCKGIPVIAETPAEMAKAILCLSKNADVIANADKDVKELIASIPDMDATAKLLSDFIGRIS